MNTNYTDARMNVSDICSWLKVRNYGDLASIISDDFTTHNWNEDGMIRTKIIKEIFECVYGTDDMFRAMECDVVTYSNIVPADEAHVD